MIGTARFQAGDVSLSTLNIYSAIVRGDGLEVVVFAESQEKADRQAAALARLLNSQMLPDGLDG